MMKTHENLLFWLSSHPIAGKLRLVNFSFSSGAIVELSQCAQTENMKFHLLITSN